ncbi:hypothetical protein AJ88_38465 [Mesorhizobium amorphae CCBAU 01583]|nr:hypothetical protein AJ88_38465 [Mesorhizobium amorphae CCBAU 01583]
MDMSVLLFTAADGGIAFTSTHADAGVQWSRQVAMSDFSIKTNQASGGTALSHTFNPTSTSSTSRMFDYQNLSIQGLDTGVDYWDNGIVITDGWNGIIERCQIKGIAGDSVSPFEMTDGVKMVRCNDCHIVRLQTDHMENGIHATSAAPSYGDGLFIGDCRIVGVGTGILSDGSVTNAWLGICNNHINAGIKGIDLTKIYYTPISENLIYKTHVSSQNNWVGIDVASGNFNIVTRNQVGTPGAPEGVTNFGVRVAVGTDNIVADNAFANTTGNFFCVYQISSTARNIIHGNVATPPSTPSSGAMARPHRASSMATSRSPISPPRPAATPRLRLPISRQCARHGQCRRDQHHHVRRWPQRTVVRTSDR